ncbi:MAG: peptidoglycan DD-metalloendopeptidase family protein [bacterium]|nr:peptidoglycan DD-metalloendopeptidase family protein [bacterium]
MFRFPGSVFIGLVVFFLVMTPIALGEELILEDDPDEILGSEFRVESVDSPERRGQYIQGYQQLFQLQQNEVEGLQAVLVPVQQDIASIDTQLQVLALQIERVRQQDSLVQEKIRGLEDLDTRYQVQEQLLALEMKDVSKKFERLLLLFFQVKRQYIMEDGTTNLLQLLSSADTPADMLFQDVLLGKVQDQLLEQMGKVYGQQMQLNELRAQLALIHRQLAEYQDRVQKSVEVLTQQNQYQQELLADKQYEQGFFQGQLDQAKEEQLIIADRIQLLATGVSRRDYAEFPEESLQWPVAPVLGISAFFHDEGYFKRFSLQHDAVDIPTDQLTPVIAPLSGKVLEVHDGGATGYSYLQLAHRDGLSTVYGHVYAFKVQEGELVRQGQLIALSGGALGTHGAGRMTTGPHLHFEVLQDGVHVNPMDYLPSLDGF